MRHTAALGMQSKLSIVFRMKGCCTCSCWKASSAAFVSHKQKEIQMESFHLYASDSFTFQKILNLFLMTEKKGHTSLMIPTLIKRRKLQSQQRYKDISGLHIDLISSEADFSVHVSDCTSWFVCYEKHIHVCITAFSHCSYSWIFKGDIGWKCHQVSGRFGHNTVTLLWHHTWLAKKPHTPMMQRMLKTAEPTMVPTPTSPLVMNTPGAAEKYTHVQTHTHHCDSTERLHDCTPKHL